jgi:hypothetical protein
MEENPYVAPSLATPTPVSRRRWFTCGSIVELALLGCYVLLDGAILLHLLSADFPALRNRYGDTPRYWNALSAHNDLCRVMMIQPVFVLLLWVICAPLFRRRFCWTTIVAVAVVIAVLYVNWRSCWYSGLGVGV